MPSVSQRPNIIQIVADDMGYGDLGYLNFGASDTANLDRLASGSIRLSQHYSGSPVCAPARAALLTGRYPHRTGAVDTLEGRGLDRIATSERTLADYLRSTGYATGLIGKWHSGALHPRYHPTARGFAEFTGFRGGWQDYWDWQLERNGTVFAADGRYLTEVLSTEAIEFVGRHRREPFYLQLAYNAPHFPFQAPPTDVEVYARRGAHSARVCILYAMIAVMDRGIGALLERLDQLGLAAQTLVMFTSDNGPQFGGEGSESTVRFNCGLTGAKGTVYEGGIRVPALVRWPDGLPANLANHEVVTFTDWLPTLLAMAGCRPSADRELDGADVSEVLRGSVAASSAPRFWQWNRYDPVPSCNAAMRAGDWKLVYPAIAQAMALEPADTAMDRALKYRLAEFDDIRRAPMPSPELGRSPSPQLFNLAADPGEEHDLAQRQPGRLARMSAELGRWFELMQNERRMAQAETLR